MEIKAWEVVGLREWKIYISVNQFGNAHLLLLIPCSFLEEQLVHVIIQIDVYTFFSICTFGPG